MLVLRDRILVVLMLLLVIPLANAADENCSSEDGYGFICGVEDAEDLVLIPNTSWILSSGGVPGASIILIDAQQKTFKGLYPAQRPLAHQNMEIYAACPGSPDPNNFVTHGMNILPGENGHSTLYVVSHGGRESIEVFDVDASGSKPALIWIGCIMMPEGLDANSVASFKDGSLVTTVLVRPGRTFRDVIAGEPTGAVYFWSPGDSGFEMIQGTELPGNNGIEVSADEQEIYVVSSGLNTIVAYSNTKPARMLRTTRELLFTPDNVHRRSNGQLVTAGMFNEDPVCGSMSDPDDFDLEKIGLCARPFTAKIIDPETMEVIDLVQGPATETFSNATMALEVNNEVWVGTFASGRVGYRVLGE